jgi:hypothetical protein
MAPFYFSIVALDRIVELLHEKRGQPIAWFVFSYFSFVSGSSCYPQASATANSHVPVRFIGK